MSSVRTRTSRIPWLRSDVPTRLGTPSCSIRLRATWRSRDSSSRPNCDSWMPHTSSGLPRTGAGALYSPELAARESRGGLDKPLACRFETLARGAPDASARHTQAANRVASPPCGALWVPAHSHPAADQRTEVRILDIFQNAASARIDAGGWIDYLHLIRWRGRWVILNVLWEIRQPAGERRR